MVVVYDDKTREFDREISTTPLFGYRNDNSHKFVACLVKKSSITSRYFPQEFVSRSTARPSRLEGEGRRRRDVVSYISRPCSAVVSATKDSSSTADVNRIEYTVCPSQRAEVSFSKLHAKP
eukprot:scaffold1428_cov159-Amphora_coffeaeformis.AAC.14